MASPFRVALRAMRFLVSQLDLLLAHLLVALVALVW